MTPVPDDDDLREGLRAGDLDRAFRVLRDRHGGALYRACFAIVHNGAIAEEAVQETFAKAFRQRRRLADADSLRAYLLQIAKNTARDLMRTTQRRRAIDRDRPTVEADTTSTALPGVEAVESAALYDCLELLTPTTRQALFMHHQDATPWQDIAAAVGLAIDTIRMRVKRALRDLRECLEGKGVTP